MQAFKSALLVALSYRVNILVYLVLFTCFCVLTAGSTSTANDQDSYAAAKAPLAIVDRDHSRISQGLQEYLGRQGQLVDVADDRNAMQDAVATGQARCLIVVPAGFGDAYLKAARSGSEEPTLDSTFSFGTVSGALVDEQATQYLGLVRAAALLQSDDSMEAVTARADKAMSFSAPVETVPLPENGQRSSLAVYFQWAAFTITVTIVLCVGLLMSAFNRTDVRRRDLVAAKSSLKLGLQKALACLMLALLVCIVSCAVGFALFGASIQGLSPAVPMLLVASALVFSLVPLSIGFLLGQLGAGKMVSNAVGNMVGLVTTFLGGFWLDMSLMGPGMAAVSRFMPTSWYVDALNASASLGVASAATVLPILYDLGMVALFAAAFFAVALVAGRLRMRSAESGGNAAAATNTA